jgi:hypothetical protein
MHRSLPDFPRPASAEPATLTVAAAYEGAVMTTDCSKPRLTCPDGGVRFGAYNRWVTTTNRISTTITSGTSAVSR